LDEILNPGLSVKIYGYQWYWSYENSDLTSCAELRKLKYNSYLLVNDRLKEYWKKGMFRSLETSKSMILLSNNHTRLLITASDVLHSYTLPSFGVKIDACPGRLNTGSLFLKRAGQFFGQCSEICGVNHGFMPVETTAVNFLSSFFIRMSQDIIMFNC
jgi:cytochrome c oxidase subunit 2